MYLVSSRSLNARARLLLRCSVRYCYEAHSHWLFGRAARAQQQQLASIAQPDRLIFAARLRRYRLVDDGNLLRAGSRRDENMAIKDTWRFDKSQWALKAGIASALVLATIAWYALECGPVF